MGELLKDVPSSMKLPRDITSTVDLITVKRVNGVKEFLTYAF